MEGHYEDISAVILGYPKTGDWPREGAGRGIQALPYGLPAAPGAVCAGCVCRGLRTMRL